MQEGEWLPGVEPERKCRKCGAAAIASELCLADLDDVEFTAILERLTDDQLILDLRGVEIDDERWTAVRAAMTPDAADGPDLSAALLAQATFGDGANLSWAKFGERADLSGVTFGDEASLFAATFGDRAILRRAKFGDKAHLNGATFGDEANLRRAKFGDKAQLIGATFGDEAHLNGATFGDEADLRRATFGDEASLFAATFGDRADLSGATFGHRADLSAATFGDEAQLFAVTFGDRASLRRATFGDEASLRRATFGDEASFADAWFVGKVMLVEVTFRGQQRILGPLYAGGAVDLHDAQFGPETRLEVDAERVVLSRAVFAGPAELRVLRARVEISETRFEGYATIGRLDEARRPAITDVAGDQRTDLDGTPLEHAPAADGSVWSLRRTDVSRLMIAGVQVDEARFAGAQGLEKLRLLDTRFEEHGGRQRVAEEALLDAPAETPTEDEERMGHPKVTAEQVAEIYRSLRKSREDAADAPGGNDLYVGEQEMRRRALREQPSQTLATWGRRALLALYAWVGGDGVRPVRSFLWLGGLLGVSWALACAVGLDKGGTDDALVFALRSVLLLPNSENITTTTAGDALQVALRVLGPLLIGLVVLGIRAQVKR